MPVIRLTEAPVKDNLVDSTDATQRVWLQYFGDLQDSTKGYWGDAFSVIEASGITSDSTINRLQLKGSTAELYIKYVEPTFSSAKLTLPKKYSSLDTAVVLTEVNTGGNIITTLPLFMKDNQITLPDMSTTNDIYLTGTLILD